MCPAAWIANLTTLRCVGYIKKFSEYKIAMSEIDGLTRKEGQRIA